MLAFGALDADGDKSYPREFRRVVASAGDDAGPRAGAEIRGPLPPPHLTPMHIKFA